jgi:hypothetical protein
MMPAILYGAPSLEDDFDTFTIVVKNGEPVKVLCGPDGVTEAVELWMPSSEKRRLEERIMDLERRLSEKGGEDIHWKAEYLLLKDRIENPHLYDDNGCPTAEALEGPKGGPIYGSPPLASEKRRRVVTIRERVLELANAFYHRGNDERLSAGARAAWKRAHCDLVVLRDHSMDRPDLPLCLKCGGTGDAFPTELEWIETDKGNPHHEMRDGKPVVQICKKCDCEDGFNPSGDINDIIDD